MKTLIPISLALLSVSFTTIPLSNNGSPLPYRKWNDGISTSAKATLLYEAIQLKEAGLSEEAFQNAYKGYAYLLTKNKLRNSAYLTICDFSQSSKNKRMYVIDIKNEKLL